MDISYRGTVYHGWQIQLNGLTVQEEIEKAMSIILQEKTAITGSGRTDAGVHAIQQIAHFDSDSKMDVAQITYKLNSFLGKNISINAIHKVTENAHARFDAVSRKYQYAIHQAKNPFKNGFSYYFPRALNTDHIHIACEFIKDRQNFECFSKVHTEVKHFICDITQIKWTQKGMNHLFEITANRFLRGMVRAIVGTLIDVGVGKTSLEDLKQILASNNRSEAGKSVPPEGLYLEKIMYPRMIYI